MNTLQDVTTRRGVRTAVVVGGGEALQNVVVYRVDRAEGLVALGFAGGTDACVVLLAVDAAGHDITT